MISGGPWGQCRLVGQWIGRSEEMLENRPEDSREEKEGNIEEVQVVHPQSSKFVCLICVICYFGCLLFSFLNVFGCVCAFLILCLVL